MNTIKQTEEYVDEEGGHKDKQDTLRQRKSSVAKGLAAVANLMLNNYNALSKNSSRRNSLSHCMSCSDLYLSLDHSYGLAERSAIKKSLSLPAWNDTLQRAVSVGDGLEEICSKLHLNVRIRNRMRSDNADAIAINRLQKDFLNSPISTEDKELFMNNDIVVIYNERTSL